MDEILKSLLTQIKTPQTYDEYKTISESDAPGQYKDTNPYNDPTSVDEYRRNMDKIFGDRASMILQIRHCGGVRIIWEI